MTYELYVFDAELAPTVEAARQAHEECPYYDTSRPASETGARKWRTARTLAAGDARRVLFDFAQNDLADNDLRHVQVAEGDADYTIRWDVFDSAVEIVIEAPPVDDSAEAVVQRLFDSLQRLRIEGYAVVLDPQLGRLVDIDGDQQAMLAAYRAALTTETPSPAARNVPNTSGSAGKPWWKIW